MERWEIIERWALVLVAAGILLAIGWSAWTGDGPSRWFGLLFLPLTFWALWQAFFEDSSNVPGEPKLPERAMAGTWLVFRRVVAWGTALLFALIALTTAMEAKSSSDWFEVALFCALAVFLVSIGLFGAGRRSSMADDRAMHAKRKRRYRWRL